jgi:hypothetical protein
VENQNANLCQDQFVQPCTHCQTMKYKTTIIQNPVQYLSLKTVYSVDLGTYQMLLHLSTFFNSF